MKRDQRSRGRYLGGAVPFGFRLGEQGELVPEPGEQAAIRHACKLKARGASLRAIEAALRERGHSISHVAISNMLRRASNVAAGLLFALLVALSTAQPGQLHPALSGARADQAGVRSHPAT
ncbi:MAG: transposon gamma-delta resolvase [Microvirga sp.]|nr:transposon gamma-delta resolvase [Microvirga sp.]